MKDLKFTIKYILILIKETPKTFYIILGNIISGFLVFIGLPMLLPTINLLQSNENNVINNDLISEFTKKLYNHLNIDFTFF